MLLCIAEYYFILSSQNAYLKLIQRFQNKYPKFITKFLHTYMTSVVQ